MGGVNAQQAQQLPGTATILVANPRAAWAQLYFDLIWNRLVKYTGTVILMFHFGITANMEQKARAKWLLFPAFSGVGGKVEEFGLFLVLSRRWSKPTFSIVFLPQGTECMLTSSMDSKFLYIYNANNQGP